jgi:hypothetical protein
MEQVIFQTPFAKLQLLPKLKNAQDLNTAMEQFLIFIVKILKVWDFTSIIMLVVGGSYYT